MTRVTLVLAATLALLVGVPPLGAAPAPEVPARAWVILDASDGEILGAQRPRARVAMASITKLMTARVVAADGFDRTLAIPAEAATIGEASAGLAVGQEIAVEDLVRMALVPSGNDAAVVLAVGTAGSQETFARRMNVEARRLGLRDTRYANPHGLDAPGHRSSALDSALLLRANLEDPKLRAILGEDAVETPAGTLQTTNLLLDTYAGVDGGKTGMTDDAGWCTVVTATRGGERLIVSVLGAQSEEDRLTAARRLLDWGFAEFRTSTVLTPETALLRIPVTGGGTLAVRAAEDVTVSLRSDERPTVALTLPRTITGPVLAGAPVGLARIGVAGRVPTTVSLVSADAVPAPARPSLVRRILDRLLPT